MTGGMTFKGTPGPWVAVNGGIITYSKDAWATNGVVTVAKCENEGNSRLISAAPELLEALMKFTEDYVEMVNSGDCGFWDPENEDKVKAARAAIDKALGEQK